MSKPKSITIKLTDKQRKQLRGLTGEIHTEVKFETMGIAVTDLSSRSALANRSGLASKSLARKSGLASKSLARKSGLASKSLARKSGLASKSLARKHGI